MNLDAIERMVRRMLAPIHRRTKLMILRGVINLVDDSTSVQKLQVETLADNIPDEAEHMQPLGLTSVPAKDQECVVLSVGGLADHPVAICAQDRTNRPTGMSEGETKLWSAHGTTVYLNASGEIVIEDASGSKITLKSTGDIDVSQSGSLVNLASASDFVALAAKVNADISSVVTQVNTAITAINAAFLLYNAHTQVSSSTFQPLDPASGGQTVTVGAPTPSMVAAIPLVLTPNTAATNVKAS